MSILEQEDEVSFPCCIKPKKDVEVIIRSAEPMEWRLKDEVYEAADPLTKELFDSKADDAGVIAFKAVKLVIEVSDENIEPETEGGQLKRTIESVFNIERYPYVNKRTGSISWLSRNTLFSIERAFGFDPCFVDEDGNEVEPFVTRNGNKIAPKNVSGVRQKLNEDFSKTFFDDEGNPKSENWEDREVLVNIGIQRSDQYGDKNTVKSFKPLTD